MLDLMAGQQSSLQQLINQLAYAAQQLAHKK